MLHHLCVFLALVPALTAIWPAPPPPRVQPAVTAPVRDAFLLTVDGEEILSPVEPRYLDGELYIPLRAVSEALGAEVVWDREDDRALVTAPGLSLEVPFGERWMDANGRCLYIPGGVTVTDGTAMVPAGSLATAFGAILREDSQALRAELTPSGVPIESGEERYGGEDLYWLSRIIDAEAGGEPFEGKIAVGNVVMNRVADGHFPDTVKGVIFDRRCGVQFSPAYSGSIDRTPGEESVRAAKIALEGGSVVPAALYFSPAYRADRSWAGKNREPLTRIGNHVFYT